MELIHLDSLVEHELYDFADKHNIDRTELEDLVKSWIDRQNGIPYGEEIENADYIRGFREGWEEAEDCVSTEAYFPVCPK